MRRHPPYTIVLSLLVASCAPDDAPLARQESAARTPPPGGEPTPRDPPPPPPTPSGGDPASPAEGAVGRIDASFDVDPTGAARYTVPIDVPPGHLGVQPKIALAYDSRGGSDLAGVGFSIGGLSRIERCPQTKAQDGQVGAVRFDGEDRFCLDGLRLVAVQGAYGADGTVYHTEAQTWSRVVSHGECKDQVSLPGVADPVEMSGPCTFEVTLKNGNRVSFGEAAQCAQLGQESPVRLSWPMTHLVDLNGNTIDVEYTSAGVNTCAPATIRYTGNENLGTTPLREVTFTYQWGRSDATTTYRGGVPFSTGALLEKVETWIRDATQPSTRSLVKSYHLQYGTGAQPIEYSASTGRALLTRLTECDTNHVCLPPTTLAWTQGDWMTNTFVRPTNGANQIPPISDDVPLIGGDFNGDGHQDFLRFPMHESSSGQYLAHPPGANEYAATAWIEFDPDENPPLARFYAGDVDGDGFTDVIWAGSEDFGGPEGIRLYKGGPTGLPTTETLSAASPSLDDELHVGDFTGDGRADILALADKNLNCNSNGTTFNGWEIHPSTGNGFGAPTGGTFTQGPFPVLWHSCDGGIEYWPTFHLADFNGDGRIDLLTTKRLEDADNPNQNSINHEFYTGWRIYLSNGSTFVESANGVWPYETYQLDIGDFNGDGLSDVLLRGEGIVSQPGYVMVRSTGRTLEPVLANPSTYTIDLLGGSGPFTMTWGTTGASPNGCDEVQIANFDADGRDDVLVTSADCYTNPYDGAKLYVSRGDSFSHAATVTKPLASHHLLARYQTHGRTGILMRSGSSDAFYQIYETPNPDLLESVVDGFAAEIEIGYGHGVTAIQHDGSVPLPTYPTRRYVGQLDYVGTVVEDNGDGDKHRSQYYYSGPKTDLAGRGFLGFERIRLAKKYPYRVLETHYHTDFPKAGLVESQLSRAQYPADLLQRKATFSYVNKPHPSYPGVYNLVTAQERVEEYTTNGALVHTRGKDYSHDTFGFVTQIVDRGDVSNSAYDVRTHITYDHDPVAWQIGFSTETRVYEDWHAPLQRTRTKYDAHRNVEYEERWDDTQNAWLTTRHEYLGDGSRWRTTEPQGAQTEFEFDAYGYLERTTNALGHAVEAKHDPRFGNEIERTDVNGNTTLTLTDGFGQPTSIVAEHPATQNLVEVRRFERTTPGFGYITQSFVRRDWSSSEWDWTEEWRDGWGRPYRNRRRGEGAQAIVVAREYSGIDELDRVSRPYFENQTPQWHDYFYDVRGRVTKIELPSGRTLRTEYDDVQRRVIRRDPNLEESQLYLSPRDALIRLVDPVGAQTVFDHDAVGRVVFTKTPSTETTTTYDSLGRKTSVVDSDTGATTFDYDTTGQLVGETDAKGQTISRTYDPLGRTVQKSYYAPGLSTSAKTVVFRYDDPALANAIGQMSEAEVYDHGSLQSSYRFAYDDAGQQTRAHLEVDGYTFNWSKRYDPAGNVVERVYPDGSVLKTGFTSAGFLDTLSLHEPTDPPGYFQTYADYSLHDAEARPGMVQFGNDVVTCWSYDSLTKLLDRTATSHFAQSISNKCRRAVATAGETPLIDLDYAWFDNNNLDRIDDLLDASRSQAFSYQQDGALTGASGPYGAKQFSYHPGGNLYLKDAILYTYQGHRPVAGNDGSSFVYDANGNLEQKIQSGSTWDFTWDPDDLLASVVRDGKTTSFVYDYGGRRLIKSDDDGDTIYAGSSYEVFVDRAGGVFHTKYIDGPGGRVAQITRANVTLASVHRQQHYAQLAAMYTPTSPSGALQRLRYTALSLLATPGLERAVWLALIALTGLGALGLMVLGVGGRRRILLASPAVAFVFLFTYGSGLAEAAMSPGANGPGVPELGTRYFHGDHLGSTSVVTDDTGAEVSRVLYEPYGGVYEAGSSGVDGFRPKFTGQERDAGTGLYYYGARYYDPSTGRFISPDRTAGAEVSTGKAFNRYAYALNNPVTYTDPSGEFVAFLVALAVGFVVGGLIAGTNGKIFTDPAHAFDNWSWSRALFGAWVGMIAGGLTFGLSTIGTSSVTAGAKLFDIAVGKVASQTFAGGALSAATEWASGERDGMRLAAYFGLGMLFAFVSGTKVMGIGKAGLSKLTSEAAISYTYSALKKAVNSEKPVELTIWFFKVSIDKNGERDFSANEFFLVSQAATMLINGWGFDQAARDRLRDGFDFEQLKYEIVDAKKRLGWVSQLTGLLSPSYGAPSSPKMIGTLSSMVKNLFHAATGPCKGGGCGFYDGVVKGGIDGGFGALGGLESKVQTFDRRRFEETYQ